MDGAAQNVGAASANSSSDFVRKLYKMLEDPTYEQVVRWGNDGNSFVVLENEKFTKAILPKHFKHSNFASFVRQLNKYDFHKVRHSNEENGQSPYGANAWEFKHPEFKMNGKDCLENIRRKAPAPRKSAQAAGEEVLPPPVQMDLVNSQLVAMQQQLQQLSDRYNDLAVHHAVLLNQVAGMQRSLVNHEQVMQNVMSYLQSTHSFVRGARRAARAPAAYAGAPDGGAVALGLNPAAPGISPVEDNMPSPLQAAERMLTEATAETLQNQRNLEQLHEMYKQVTTSTVGAGSPETAMPRPDPAAATPSAPAPAATANANATGLPDPASLLDFTRLNADLQDVVYPVGHNNGIDPMFGEHVHNIPYPLPAGGANIEPPDPRKAFGESRKKSTTIDPGWIRAPQILLVEDDPTCRRIGGKFLYSFKCAIDTAFDGLEAVNKMNTGSKYDLVLMDIIMPSLDGVSATHLIRQFDSTPIIAMTSNIRSDDITMYFAHGMNDVLPKPFTKEGLLTILEKHLGHLKDTPGVESTQFAQLMTHDAARQSSKDDSSSAKSPSTGNWQSPTQVPGVSPKSHGLIDEFTAVTARGGTYVIEGAAHHDHFTFPTPDGGRGVARVEGHRRQISQISDASAGEDPTNDMKRQRRYPPPPADAVAASSQSNRPMGWT